MKYRVEYSGGAFDFIEVTPDGVVTDTDSATVAKGEVADIGAFERGEGLVVYGRSGKRSERTGSVERVMFQLDDGGKFETLIDAESLALRVTVEV